jgi:hypothetical protein
MRAYELELRIFLTIIFPLALGVLIYFLFQGFHLIDPKESVFPLVKMESIPYWIRYNLADGLWLYSFIATITIIWKAHLSFYYNLWIIIALLSAILLEVFQSYNIVPGTFDWYDLLSYVIFACIFFAVSKINIKGKRIKPNP